MRSEKEMREFLDSVDGCLDIVNQSWGDAIEWVLAGDKEAVVCPMLGEVLEEWRKDYCIEKYDGIYLDLLKILGKHFA